MTSYLLFLSLGGGIKDQWKYLFKYVDDAINYGRNF